jgi:hypothetical protein
MGNWGTNKDRQPSPCMFCGSDRGLRCYPTDVPCSVQYACAECVALISKQDSDDLIERILAAFASLQPIPEDEQVAFRQELKSQLQTLTTWDLAVM